MCEVYLKFKIKTTEGQQMPGSTKKVWSNGRLNTKCAFNKNFISQSSKLKQYMKTLTGTIIRDSRRQSYST